MKKSLRYIIDNYYLLLVINAIVMMIGGKDLYGIITAIVVIGGVISAFRIRYTFTDYLVLVFMLYALMSFLWTDSSRLFYLGFKSQIAPISFYFIARAHYFKKDAFLKKMWWPLLFAYLCGLFLYINPPEWYLSYKLADKDVAYFSDDQAHEFTRLSSFWKWSYFVGYSSLILLMFELKRYFLDGYRRKFLWYGLGLTFLVMFFAQQRAPIAFFIMYVFTLLLYCSNFKRIKKKKIFSILFAIFFICIIIYILLTQYFDDSLLDYILNRSVNNKENMAAERFKMFSKLLEQLSFLGGGLGTFGHDAYALTGKMAAADCDYIRFPLAYGLPGTLLFIMIVITSLLNGLKHLRQNFFYLSCVCYMLFAAIGAAVLEMTDLQVFIYWYALGMLQPKRRVKLKLLSKNKEKVFQ